ncbi:MAG: ABC transporter permease [Candidatus Brockarchaeota archaeon]|nr:ABC transporter permease [Candidatus Brockarchaeota archaeon]
MKVRLERRGATSARLVALSRLFAVVLALPITSVVFLACGTNPAKAIAEIFGNAFGSWFGICETIVKSIPLILCGVGLTVAYKAGIISIGAEGQLLFGAIASTWVAIYSGLAPPLVLPLMFLLGGTAGAAYAVLPGILRAKFGLNEIIVTLMLNYVAQNFLVYLVTGPWKGKGEWGFPQTDKFPDYACLGTIPGTRIPYVTLALALLSVAILHFQLFVTKLGYEMRVLGDNPEAARFAGMRITYLVAVSMAISGFLSGIAGVGEVAGMHQRLKRGISPGYGFTAIIPAWLSNLNPIFVLPASLLMGGLFVGGDAIQISLKLPFGIVNVFNGTILLLLASGEFLARYKLVVEA